jgi:uncharacterized protein
MIVPSITIAPSPLGGNGVFATKRIPANTIIEISPVLVFNRTERQHVEATLLYNYIFEWGDDHTLAALGLGYISLYNHSYTANCDYDMDYETATMTIATVKDIAVGEELCINYNGQTNNDTPVWFNTTDIPQS